MSKQRDIVFPGFGDAVVGETKAGGFFALLGAKAWNLKIKAWKMGEKLEIRKFFRISIERRGEISKRIVRKIPL